MRRAFRGTVFVSTAVAVVACSSFGGDDEPAAPAPSPDASVATDGSSLPHDGAAPDAGGPIDGGEGPCPVGLGPEMVVVQVSSMRSICIDRAEVSSAEYAAFRAQVTDVTPLQPMVPSGCEMLAAPALDPADDAGALPRRYVSFCSAAFYCAAQGKRLCGSLADGGGVTVTSDGGATVDPPLEWEAACSAGKSGTYYPWGTTDPEPASTAGCLTSSTTPDAAGPRPVATTPVCGPMSGPFDMIGNVWEWVNLRIDQPGTPVSYSAVRGGAWGIPTVTAGCATPHGMDAPLEKRASGRPDVGFRCCADRQP